MSPRNKRRPARKLLALSLFAAICGAGISSLHAQTISAPGLRGTGSISYDANGVPTITASSDEDAAWLMGYAHAHDAAEAVRAVAELI